MLVLHVCTTQRAGEGQDPSLLGQGKAAGDQGWPRATPAAAKRGVQLHLVGSDAPPPPQCHHIPLATTRRQGALRAGAYGPAFPVTTRKHPGDDSLNPGFGLLQHLEILGSLSLWMHTQNPLRAHRYIYAHSEHVQRAPGQLVQSQLCPCDLSFAC